jgi:hypothetical protein
MAARWTSYAREAISEQPASCVASKLALDILRQRTGIVVSCVLEKCIEVLSHDGVQHGGFRLPSLVGPAGDRLVDVERQLLGDGLGMHGHAREPSEEPCRWSSSWNSTTCGSCEVAAATRDGFESGVGAPIRPTTSHTSRSSGGHHPGSGGRLSREGAAFVTHSDRVPLEIGSIGSTRERRRCGPNPTCLIVAHTGPAYRAPEWTECWKLP